ncbi:MAG TPA: hypothetical protein VFA15_01615, partial [Nitrososphaera sp.]|nr:hypothetical protein [Nitrososphaera sp.]
LEASRRLEATEFIVIENAPLGVQAANNGGLECVVVLNNSPLSREDFKGLIAPERIYDSISSIRQLVGGACQP